MQGIRSFTSHTSVFKMLSQDMESRGKEPTQSKNNKKSQIKPCSKDLASKQIRTRGKRERDGFQERGGIREWKCANRLLDMLDYLKNIIVIHLTSFYPKEKSYNSKLQNAVPPVRNCFPLVISSDPQTDCPVSGIPTDLLGLTSCPLHLLWATDPGQVSMWARNKRNVSTDTILEDFMCQRREGNKENDIQREYVVIATHFFCCLYCCRIGKVALDTV